MGFLVDEGNLRDLVEFTAANQTTNLVTERPPPHQNVLQNSPETQQNRCFCTAEFFGDKILKGSFDKRVRIDLPVPFPVPTPPSPPPFPFFPIFHRKTNPFRLNPIPNPSPETPMGTCTVGGRVPLLKLSPGGYRAQLPKRGRWVFWDQEDVNGEKTNGEKMVDFWCRFFHGLVPIFSRFTPIFHGL